MVKNVMLKRVLSGLMVLTLLFQPISFQAKENLMEKVSNVNILIQEPMNALFQPDEMEDATVEKLEYRYSFKQDRGSVLSAKVNMIIDMQVLDVDYQIEAEGEVSGEKLSSGKVLWIGPLTGDISIHGAEYLVLVGFTKLNDNVQVSVTIQAKEGCEEIEPVMFSFGDAVITESIYQELVDKSETVSSETNVSRNRAASTFAMDRVEITDGKYKFEQLASKSAKFSSSLISGNGQTMYGYYSKETNRLAISLKTYCSNVQKYYAEHGSAGTEIHSMKYSLKRGSGANMYIAGVESFDFNVAKFGQHTLIMGFFADAFTLLNWSVPTATLTEVLSRVGGYITKNHETNHTTIEVKFGSFDHANFDACSNGMPVVFQLAKSNSLAQNFILQTSICYRTQLYSNYSGTYTTYYNYANDASSTVVITN